MVEEDGQNQGEDVRTGLSCQNPGVAEEVGQEDDNDGEDQPLPAKREPEGGDGLTHRLEGGGQDHHDPGDGRRGGQPAQHPGPLADDDRIMHEQADDLRGQDHHQDGQDDRQPGDHGQVEPKRLLEAAFVAGPVGVADQRLGPEGKADHHHDDDRVDLHGDPHRGDAVGPVGDQVAVGEGGGEGHHDVGDRGGDADRVDLPLEPAADPGLVNRGGQLLALGPQVVDHQDVGDDVADHGGQGRPGRPQPAGKDEDWVEDDVDPGPGDAGDHRLGRQPLGPQDVGRRETEDDEGCPGSNHQVVFAGVLPGGR